MRRYLTCALMITASILTIALGRASAQALPTHREGVLPNGATWVADVPDHWNGVLLLFCHGFNPGPANPARNAPRQGKDWLLQHGFALAGSSYASVGWALEDAVPDQLATLDVFVKQFGAPKRTIVWGESMGGLVTLALIEGHPERFDGALPMCASVAGVVGMMNQALDAAFTLRTLVDPASTMAIVGVGARATADAAGLTALQDEPGEVSALLDKARATPGGRARAVLAAVLAQIPDWSNPRMPEPAPDDFAAIERGLLDAFPMGAFFPRRDQERRAGGNFSWNVGVDYRRQLALSGRRALVEAFYRQAGLDLEMDLDALGRAAGIEAAPQAVAYMKRHYVPSGDLRRPVLSLHTTGDGMTMVTYEQAYAAAVASAGKGALLRQAFVVRPGHCTFNDAEVVASLLALDERIQTGDWAGRDRADQLNAKAADAGLQRAGFVDFSPAPFLRPCSAQQRTCAGEP